MENKYSDSILEVDISKIIENYNYLKKSSNGAICSSVVKSDCYGLGAKNIAPKLKDAGCEVFFVATLDEAIDLRKNLGKEPKINVFHGVKFGEEDAFENYNITPVINDFYQLELWSKYSISQSKKLPSIIHVDTGMNRLGFTYKDTDKLLDSEDLQFLDIKYIMSHLSCITEEGHPLNSQQVERMAILKNKFKLPCSLSNSRAIFAGDQYHFDMVRPGSMLYGIKGNACHTKIKNVATLKAKIIQIRDVDEDSFVGYGAMAAVRKGEKIAVVPIGYADGYQRILSNNSHAHIDGVEVPLMGRVSMDMVIINITQFPEGQIKIGDFVEFFGQYQRVDELAERANTIGYEIMTSLGSRYKRIYK